MAVITELDSYTSNQLGFEEQRMLQDYIASEIDQHSDDYEKLVQFFMQSTQSQVDFEAIDIQPQPGFVCKTRIVQNAQNKTRYPRGTVIYINVTYNCHLSGPPVTSEEEIQKALRGEKETDYRLPLAMGQPRLDDSKKQKKETGLRVLTFLPSVWSCFDGCRDEHTGDVKMFT